VYVNAASCDEGRKEMDVGHQDSHHIDSGHQPTVKDVARLAKVSIGTVDRVLHERGRVSRETAHRVREAVRSLGYSPNPVASNLSRARHRRFAVLMPDLEQDGGYWKIVLSGMESALSELAHHYISLTLFPYDRSDTDSLLRALEEVKRAGGDGVLFAPSIFPASKEIISELSTVPCVVFDGEVPEAQVLSTINQDSLESGLLAGKLLHLLEPHGPYVSVTVGSADYHQQRRREGFIRYFSEQGNHTLLHIDVETKNVPTAIHNAIAEVRHGARAVFVTNAMAHLVARELNSTPDRHVPIVGYDLIPENEACLRTRQIDFVINQEPWRQGYSSVYTLYRHVVLKERVEPRIRMPIGVVMRENLGFHSKTNPDA
jgi:LacI family transcriptional regulator